MSQIINYTPSSGPGSGTVTSISAATGITLTPNPITSTGTVGLTIPVVVSSGGTGVITGTAYAPVVGGTTSTNPFQFASTGQATSGFILTSTGNASLPTWQAPAASSISITGNSGGALVGNAFTFTGGTTGLTFSGAGSTETLTGTLVVANGGTGIATATAYAPIIAGTTATGPFQVASTGQATAGFVLTSNGNAALPSWQAAGGGSSFTWTVTTVNASLVAANGYIANKAGLLTMTLPASGAIGDTIRITNMNTAVGWRIAQNANQFIRLGSSLTTTGATGYLEATALGDSVEIVCNVAGASTGWIVQSSMGNITVN